ncbi:polysaccharide lyase family 1 protein [Pseudoalteromonas sp. SG44-17]|uniref:pectate lyase family protein n=1 Tax=Pseudoalteromonas sp. SG44-17 TaxID=2760963 RepID=UPI001603EE33|nr:hypothetical protein [Pseudoalteromonas sp. SG44-17]MBB1408869.1 hypothetical protein [Pseudoalteromonas sp. SG44-17]
MQLLQNNHSKYLHIAYMCMIFVFTISISAKLSAEQINANLAFPSAQGFGKYATGGKGGELYIVTSLADQADKPIEGTLRYAVEQKHPRTIVFAVSGVIKLVDELKISHGNITIAGQSSPGGITLIGAPVIVSSSTNVIIRYMRFRLGTFGYADDSLSVRNSDTVIIDHCSLSWSVDETASFYNNRNFTLQNSMISHSLSHSIHPKGDHGYGGIWGGANASFINNILANHASRTPRINGHRLKSPYAQNEEFVEIINNIIFNWGHNNVYGSENGRFNLINNYYKPGKASKIMQFADIWYSPEIKENQAYIMGNVLENNPQLSEHNYLGVNYRKAVKAKRTKSDTKSPWLSDKVIITSAVQESLAYISAEQAFYTATKAQDIGASKNANGRFIDSVDNLVYQQLIDAVPIKKNGLIDHEFELIGSWDAYEKQFIGFTAITDADQDGVDDNWLKQHQPQLKNATKEHVLQQYLNSLSE